MPNIVGTGTALASANALSALSGSVLRLSAPVLGALLLSGPGITSVLIIDVGSYLISAALLGRSVASASNRHRRAKPMAYELDSHTLPAPRPCEDR